MTVHQIAFDGWSIRILAHEFGTIAAALDANVPHGLPEPLLQYGDYCLWQKEYFASGSFEAETAYWKNKLAGAPYFEIVPDHERPGHLTYGGEILAAVLPPELGDKLEEAARKHNLTVFSFGCAVTALMLHRYSGATDMFIRYPNRRTRRSGPRELDRRLPQQSRDEIRCFRRPYRSRNF